MVNAKLRRHEGRITPRIVKGIPGKELFEQGIDPQVRWNDWKDYRDGMRGSKDRTQLRSPYMQSAKYFNVGRWNVRLKKLILRRKLRRLKQST